ncbi:MAG: antitoxin [Anaerotignum sp.]|nr:antitoxin [Anaerotignum sp.]
MAYTERKKINNKKWDEKNLKRISLAVPIDLAEKLEQYLEETGMSKNGFIVSLIREKMEALGK